MSALRRLIDWLWPKQPAELAWRVQHASFAPISGNPLLHYAYAASGTFEIFEDGVSFLLHFPRGMRMPAELFYSLAAAKHRAALIASEPKS